jgi:ubiquinone/menaquinone biosynthesis C-methylase UbiE
MLSWTGERFIPGAGGPQIHAEHLHRYAIASDFAVGKRVLDFGSGEGYGAAHLARVASKVDGIDVDVDAVSHASTMYVEQANLDFHVGNSGRLPFEDNSFDLVTCFEVIEHVSNQDAVIDEVRRVLKSDGIALVSTPDKKTYSDDRNYRNEFHLKEFYVSEFADFLGQYFPQVKFYGQRIFATSVMWNIDSEIESQLFRPVSDLDVSAVWPPMYVVAVCGASSGADLGASFLNSANDQLTQLAEAGISQSEMLKLLDSWQEERTYAQKILDEWEAELAARASALEKAAESDRLARERIVFLESEIERLSELESPLPNRSRWSRRR